VIVAIGRNAPARTGAGTNAVIRMAFRRAGRIGAGSVSRPKPSLEPSVVMEPIGAGRVPTAEVSDPKASNPASNHVMPRARVREDGGGQDNVVGPWG
jgi:hypothetical protein